MNREEERFLIGLNQALFVLSLLDIGDLNSLFSTCRGMKGNCVAVGMQLYLADTAGEDLTDAISHVARESHAHYLAKTTSKQAWKYMSHSGSSTKAQ